MDSPVHDADCSPEPGSDWRGSDPFLPKKTLARRNRRSTGAIPGVLAGDRDPGSLSRAAPVDHRRAGGLARARVAMYSVVSSARDPRCAAAISASSNDGRQRAIRSLGQH